MIECVNGNGQGACDICLIVKGWSRVWSSSLYYVKNAKGLYLRKIHDSCQFDSDVKLPCAAFCYGHALFVEDARKSQPDWMKGE